ncbi:TraR/DksA C4-type zinc finger protein [Acidithiobacillus sp.]|uniref:TraR/DksA C4-type zinc finger protein n=1 Tax=Acidithiobacillus sp. TaxID=1872118 RepID=UPI003D06B218
MQEINIEDRLTDISDVASRNEQMDLAMRLAARRMASRTREQPDEDEQGNRYCLDCGDDIPPERVRAVDAVRCVVCAGKRERLAKLSRQHGGAGRAIPFPANPGEEEKGSVRVKDIDDDE